MTATPPIHVVHVLPDLERGGGQQLLLRNLEGFSSLPDAADFQHTICSASDRNPMAPEFERVGATILTIPARSQPEVFQSALKLTSRLRRLPGRVLVHTNNTGIDRRLGQLAAWRAERPVVNTIHAEAGPLPSGVPGRTKDAMEGWLARRVVRRVVAVSNAALSTWTPWLDRHDVAPEGRVVVHPGLRAERFELSREDATVRAVRAQFRLDAARPVIVHVARLVPGKGHAHLLAVLERVREVHPAARLLLVGDGPDRDALLARSRERGLSDNVIFAGERADVPALLAASDLMAFPSLSEGFGLAPLEAMAAGLPVVAFELASLREFVEHNASGILVPRGDEHALAEGILALLAHPDRPRAMGERGRQIVRDRFTQRHASARLAQVYRDALREHDHAPGPA